MTTKQKTYHGSLIRQVHTSKRYGNYFRHHREDYEDLLVGHFGQSSSKDLDISQLEVLVGFLNHRRDDLPLMIRAAKCMPATQKQIGKIRKMWTLVARDTSDGALLNFIKRQTRRKPDAVEEVGFDEARNLIVALERMHDAHTNGTEHTKGA